MRMPLVDRVLWIFGARVLQGTLAVVDWWQKWEAWKEDGMLPCKYDWPAAY